MNCKKTRKRNGKKVQLHEVKESLELADSDSKTELNMSIINFDSFSSVNKDCDLKDKKKKKTIESQFPIERVRTTQTEELKAESLDESALEKRFEDTSTIDCMLDLLNNEGFVQMEDIIDEASSSAIKVLEMPLRLEDCSFSQLI